MMNLKFLVLVLTIILLSLAVAITVMHFKCGCKPEHDAPSSVSALKDMILGMPNCSDTESWSKCMGGKGGKECIKVSEGIMPSGNKVEGCWVKDAKHDPCMHFMEGGPSPDMVPKKCGSTCCSGGYYVKSDVKSD